MQYLCPVQYKALMILMIKYTFGFGSYVYIAKPGHRGEKR